MFDIISFIREKVFKKPKILGVTPGEELSEKQTTKMGYFLLMCMFLAIIISAEWSLDTIRNIPSKPNDIPNCIGDMVRVFDKKTDTYYENYVYSYNDCSLVSDNPKFDFTKEYNLLLPIYNQIYEINQKIISLESQKNDISFNQNSLQNDYNTSLSEKIANEKNTIYDKNKIKETIKSNNESIKSLDNEINSLKTQIETLKQEDKQNPPLLVQKYKNTIQDYNKAFLLYKIYVAALSFIFSLTIFLVLYRVYLRLKLKNSEITVIFSVATFAYGLIVLQVSVMFIWDILPHKLFEYIISFLSIFSPLLFLVQFLWPFAIIGIFGFLVFKIQKRLYSPENVLKRFISDKKCLNCGNHVDITKPFCPLCSYEIQVKCEKCNNYTLKGLPYCSNCGSKN